MARWRYNPKTLSYELLKEPKVLKHLRSIGFVVLAAGLVVMYFWLYLDVFGWDLPKTARLKKEHAAWQAKIDVINRHLDNYEEILGGIEDRDDDVYRSIYGLNPVPAEVKNAGFGGVNRYEYLDRFGADQDLMNTVRRLDVLTKRTSVQSMALDEVSSIAVHAGDMIACVPAVPPIMPSPGTFHISSSFGYRTDPVYGGREFHRGQDIAAEKGVPVYATGDGVVELANFHFGGYGNEVMIDHGYGYKTHYAHLSAISVSPGMKVTRGDCIGAVGNSGKSTGPHLHYEVIYMGKYLNPMTFMDLNMNVDEYKAMVDKRKAEDTRNQTASTSALIRKRH